MRMPVARVWETIFAKFHSFANLSLISQNSILVFSLNCDILFNLNSQFLFAHCSTARHSSSHFVDDRKRYDLLNAFKIFDDDIYHWADNILKCEGELEISKFDKVSLVFSHGWDGGVGDKI